MNNDLISRSELKKAFDKPFWEKWEWEIICKYIDNAPTITPKLPTEVRKALEVLKAMKQGKWIPVSERLPNRNGCYIVTRIVEETPLSDVCYFDGQNTWHSDNRVNHGRPYLTDIIAWQPLPEPYKKGGAE